MPVLEAMPMAAGRNLGLGRFRNARAKGGVWTSAIVVIRPLAKDTPEVVFSQRDEIVQTSPPNCADQPLARCVCHRTANRSLQEVDTEAGQRGIEIDRKG